MTEGRRTEGRRIRHGRILTRDLGFSVTLGHFWPSRGGNGHVMLEVGRS